MLQDGALTATSQWRSGSNSCDTIGWIGGDLIVPWPVSNGVPFQYGSPDHEAANSW
ncbi:hypothetical protein MPL1032_240019 [Mesorhizobium plurifarium]|uniref:Uncharacterized protein n=1 Tax=Mesorhizobium plurifarium TaxID=69974 RepID=A0A0K2W033_MESPL|nr:hypothetical protein MPL1032_240019 [Mesorhizobium plurifarium]